LIDHTGFVRVGLLNETEHGAQKAIGSDSLDHNLSSQLPMQQQQQQRKEQDNDTLTPGTVVAAMSPNDETPSIRSKRRGHFKKLQYRAGASARQLPQSQSAKSATASSVISVTTGLGHLLLTRKRLPAINCWVDTGVNGAFGDEAKPSPHADLIAQQGGWMATREQIMRLHTGQCQGAFVPP
jgi:hypothetical protein